LTKDDRAKLFPTSGKLFPEGIIRLARADDVEGVKGAVDCYAEYHGFFDPTGEKSLEDKFFQHEVFLNKRGFMQQFGYGAFYCWLKLKEQECRNIVWIAECISLGRKDQIGNYIPIF
jgi:V-type H+-transporting ATPase subunit d